MKIKRYQVSFLIVVLIISLAFIYKGNQNKKQKQNNKDMLRFSIITPLSDNPYWNKAFEGAKKACNESGVDLKYVGQNNLNINEQIDSINTAIASKVDGIVTVAVNPDMLTPVITKAKEAGIPIILIDSDAAESQRDMYIGTDNVQAGYKAGEEIIKATGGRGEICIITSTLDASNLNNRIIGIKNAIKYKPNMKIVAIKEGKSDPILISQKIQEALHDYPNISAVICVEGYGAVGVGNFIDKNNLMGKLIVLGFDDLNETLGYIKTGTIYGTVVQKPYDMGYKSIKELIQLKKGKVVENKINNTDIVIVTKNNVDAYMKKAK